MPRKPADKKAAKKPASARSIAMARAVEEGGLVVRHWRGNFHVFDGAVYRKCNDNRLKQILLARFENNDQHPSAALVKEVADLLAIRFHTDELLVPPFRISEKGKTLNVLALRDRLLDLSPLAAGEAPKLLDFTPDMFVTGRANYEFDPSASCPLFDRFMRWFTCGDAAVEELLYQFAGYCLLVGVQLQKFVILVGEGSNGKSVYLHTLRHLLGEENVSAVPLERFSNRFALASLVNKRANIVADMSEITKVAEGILKELVDGSAIDLEEKFKPPYSAPTSARFIFASNVLPRFRDRSQGLWRRLVIIPCKAVMPEDEAIESFEKTFLPELPGILNKAIDAARRLVGAGRFVVPEVCQRAVRAEQLEANPAAQFTQEHIQPSPGAFVASEDIFAEYQRWCDRWGFTGVLHRGHFFKEMKKLRPSAKKARCGGDWKDSFRPYGYENIVCLKDHGEPPVDFGEDGGSPAPPVVQEGDGPVPF